MTHTPANILFLGTHDDKVYLPRLKSLVGDATVWIITEPVTTLTEVILYCKKRGVTGVLTTNSTVLQKLVDAQGGSRKVSIDNWAGSYFLHQGIEFVILDPLAHLVKVSYGSFVAKRYISKLTVPETWRTLSDFKWEQITPSNFDAVLEVLAASYAIAVDIETVKEPEIAISCIGYTGIIMTPAGMELRSFVLAIDSMYAVELMRKLNWLPPAKILQNGKYDCSYLTRYNAPLYNYLWDTATLFHCWYSELPKDLAYLGAFFLRKTQYWKDLADTNDKQQYYLYNAKDTWNTAEIWISMMLEIPDYVRQNYLMEFPLLFPCHLAEMTGVKRDMTAMKSAESKQTEIVSRESASLDKMLGVKGFNTNSPKQMKALLTILGCGDLTSADEKNLKKAAFRHPLNAKILDKITEVRKARKLISTYLTPGKEFGPAGKERILYSLNPHGTDTGRLASKEHHFWCGLQVQNIPRGKIVKSTLCADPGFRIAEVDLEQAESRDTAYIAGDEALISAVTGTRDFHSVNCSAFFGVPYESIYSDEKKKTLDKALRDLAKRVNHGANYNMGAGVLVETMGLEKIFEAKRLLKLPASFSAKQVAEYLLAQFHKTYPSIAGTYYPSVVHSILTTRMLVGATGWTRYCFGKPHENKSDLNAYVAHCPQSLNAMTLNEAFLAVFYEIALHPEYGQHFKLCAQIHDSILFQFREGHEYLAELVRTKMEIPVTIKGCDGKIRTFTVPAAIKAGADGKGSKYWSETE